MLGTTSTYKNLGFLKLLKLWLQLDLNQQNHLMVECLFMN